MQGNSENLRVLKQLSVVPYSVIYYNKNITIKD